MAKRRYRTRVTAEDVAELLGVSAWTVRKAARDGEVCLTELASVVAYLKQRGDG